MRTHANHPHHRARLLAVLDVADDPEAVVVALAERSAREAEETVYAAGGLAVALRTPEEWAAHEQAAALRSRPLVELARLDASPARVLTAMPTRGGGRGSAAADGRPGAPGVTNRHARVEGQGAHFTRDLP